MTCDCRHHAQDRHVSTGCQANEEHRPGSRVLPPLLAQLVVSVTKLMQMAKLRPEMEALQSSVKNTGTMFSNPAATEAHTDKLRLLFKKHDVHPLKSFLGMFAQAPLFVTFFWTLQNMAERNTSFTSGGFGHFMDLRFAELCCAPCHCPTRCAARLTPRGGTCCRSSLELRFSPTWRGAAKCVNSFPNCVFVTLPSLCFCNTSLIVFL